MICCDELCSSKTFKIIVELGMGDGRLLRKLLDVDKEANRKDDREKRPMYIGIEIEKSNYDKAKSLLENFANVKLINGSFEVLINDFSDCSIDEIISVLPDSEFIRYRKAR